MKKLMILIVIIFMLMGCGNNSSESISIYKSTADKNAASEEKTDKNMKVTAPPIKYIDNLLIEGYNSVKIMEAALPKELSEEAQLITDQDAGLRIIKFENKIFIEGEHTNLIKKLEIDVLNNTITTDYGTCEYSSPIAASSDQVTGQWNGQSWRLEDNSGLKVQISIGQLKESKETIIHFELKRIENLNLEEVETLLF